MSMFPLKYILFFLLACVYVTSETALVDTLKKCSVKDNQCLKGVYQSLINTLAKEGASELGVNKIDPIKLKELSVTVLGILNITLIEGTIEGFRSCELKNFINDVEHGKASLHVLCDKVTIFGRFEMELFGPLLQTSALDINDVRGKGNGKIIIDKVEVRLEYPFHFEKKDDGVHFKLDTSNTYYTFNVLEKATFEADDLEVGDKKASTLIIKYMNDNWKVILQTFGKYFFDKAMEYVHVFSAKIFESVPTQYFIIEDLTEYVKQ